MTSNKLHSYFPNRNIDFCKSKNNLSKKQTKIASNNKQKQIAQP